MFDLKLSPGPVLTKRIDSGELVDVTGKAVYYLFDSVEIDPAVTLGDIMRLLDLSPALKEVYRRDFSVELVDEARKGALPDEDPYEDRIEYLELYQIWNFNSSTRTYQPIHQLNLSGVGVELKADKPDHGLVIGQRIRWGVSTAGIRKLLNLCVKVNLDVLVCEDDPDAKDSGRELNRVSIEGVSLGQVIHGLLWELSFHGGPADQAEFMKSLIDDMNEAKADVEAGALESIEHEDFFEELDRPGIALMFDTVGAISKLALARSLRDIGDEENVSVALSSVFGEAVVVKEQFRHLGGHAFRKKFREAV